MTPGAGEALGAGGGVRTVAGEGRNDAEGTTANHRHPRRRARQSSSGSSSSGSESSRSRGRQKSNGGGGKPVKEIEIKQQPSGEKDGSDALDASTGAPVRSDERTETTAANDPNDLPMDEDDMREARDFKKAVQGKSNDVGEDSDSETTPTRAPNP